jgi:ComF family protein
MRGVRFVVAELAASWLDAMFVPRCLGCGRGGSHFCAPCRRAIQLVPYPWCERCGRPVPLVGVRCPPCRQAPSALSGVRSVGLLEGPLRRAVHRLKYRGGTAAGRHLAELLAGAVATLDVHRRGGGPAVVPVPLHPDRERERGYNQAALLAAPLADRLGLPYRPTFLQRWRPTSPQVGLSRQARRENVQGAFLATADVDQAILLVDDVVTTGSTLASAGAACLAAGAPVVYAATLAREG